MKSDPFLSWSDVKAAWSWFWPWTLVGSIVLIGYFRLFGW